MFKLVCKKSSQPVADIVCVINSVNMLQLHINCLILTRKPMDLKQTIKSTARIHIAEI